MGGISRDEVKISGQLLLLLLLSLCCRRVYQTVGYLYVLFDARLFDAARGKHFKGGPWKAARAFFSCAHVPLEPPSQQHPRAYNNGNIGLSQCKSAHESQAIIYRRASGLFAPHSRCKQAIDRQRPSDTLRLAFPSPLLTPSRARSPFRPVTCLARSDCLSRTRKSSCSTLGHGSRYIDRAGTCYTIHLTPKPQPPSLSLLFLATRFHDLTSACRNGFRVRPTSRIACGMRSC